jgi:putative endonuclease
VSFGEIDIIAKDGNTLSFIEVKYRSNSRYGYPGEALTQKKQNTIKRVAGIYLSKNKPVDFCTYRFDVVVILGKEVSLIKNAFGGI